MSREPLDRPPRRSARGSPRPASRVARAGLGLALCAALALLSLLALTLHLSARAEQTHPPIGELVMPEGRALHLRDRGEPATPLPGAPPLLLLHGASTSLLDFEPALAPALAARFRVVSLDRPGHGYSARGEDWPDPYRQARAAAAALDALDIERALWVGHSWAGAVVLAAALELPERVAGGVLIGAVTHPWDDDDPWPAALAAHPLLGPPFAWTVLAPAGRLALDDAIAEVFAPEAVPAGYVEATGLTLSLRPAVYRANAEDRTRLSAHLERQSRRYGGIERPLLSITGEADHVVPPANHDARLARALPALERIAYAGAGHGLHHTRADEIAQAVERFASFVATLDSPGGRSQNSGATARE